MVERRCAEPVEKGPTRAAIVAADDEERIVGSDSCDPAATPSAVVDPQSRGTIGRLGKNACAVTYPE